jgi:acyl transferase domain-containing protein
VWAFVIKPLADAVLENDRIYGVIRGVELNRSGNAHSITHPHVDTQERLMQKLLRKIKLDARSVNVVEAHGTGTQVCSFRTQARGDFQLRGYGC